MAKAIPHAIFTLMLVSANVAPYKHTPNAIHTAIMIVIPSFFLIQLMFLKFGAKLYLIEDKMCPTAWEIFPIYGLCPYGGYSPLLF